MGGFGSGRYGGRPVIESGLTLDLNRLIKSRHVRPGKHISGAITWTRVRSGKKVASIGYEAMLEGLEPRWVRLHYTVGSKPMDYRVYVTATPCNFGGSRWWWQCPLTSIRAAKLYLPPGGKTFAARRAYRVHYESQREAPIDRTHARQRRLYKMLGADYEHFEQCIPQRPKGMHNKTYDRLVAELEGAMEAHEQVFMAGSLRILAKFDLFK